MGRKHTEQASKVTVKECGFDEAMSAVNERHRRRGALPRVQVHFCLVAILDGEPAGYAVIGAPCSPKLNPQKEVMRVVSWKWGAASALYREAEKRGATLTYTDHDENGHSLRAAGWRIDRIGRTGPYWSNRSGRKNAVESNQQRARVRWRPPSF